MSKKEATKRLKELAKSYNEYYDEFYGWSTIEVPEHYRYHESEIVISGPFNKLYNDFIKFLESEKELEYMIENSKCKRFVKDEMNKFVLDIILDEKCCDREGLEDRIKKLLDTIYKPFEKYRIVIPIEYFSTDESYSFEIDDSVISKFDLNKLKKDALDSHEDYKDFFKDWDKFENHYCISVHEEGNNRDLIVKRARRKASKCIDILRLYFYEMRYRTFAAKYFVTSESAFVFDSNGRFVGCYNEWGEGRPINERLSEEYVKEIYNCITKFNSVNQIKDTKTKEHIERTIYWLGKAVSEPDLDISLIFYCTALESLLIPETEGRKAEALALRATLVGKMKDRKIYNPFKIYSIYLNRSLVIHGAADRIVDDKDLLSLESMISRILYSFIDFACINPQLKLSDHITKLETFEDMLVVFRHLFLHSGEFEHFIELGEYIMNDKLLQGRYIKITKSKVIRLKDIPSSVLDTFFQAAKSDDFGVKYAAVFSIGLLEEPSAVELLTDIYLKDDNIEIRKYAILGLGRINNQTSLDLLIRVLDNEDKVLREAAARALGWIGGTRAVETLIKSLKDEEVAVRVASAKALGNLSFIAFDPLIKALEDTDSDVVAHASVALGKFEDPRAIRFLRIAKEKKIIRTLRAIDWAINKINGKKI